jgi:hypothetical protein
MTDGPKGSWLRDAWKWTACLALLGFAWWLWQRTLAGEFRQAFSSRAHRVERAPE